MRIGIAALCALACVWIAWTVTLAADRLAELREMQIRLGQVREQDRQLVAGAQQEGMDLSAPILQTLPAEVGLANELLAKRSFSWTQFLSGLEEAIPQRVSIKSVRLDSVGGMIHLTGAAITVEDMTALTVKFQDHPVFRDPVLGQHHIGGDGLVEFDLSLKYNPQGAAGA
jgi:Tfp pilus assembly protein PilN